MARLLKPRHLNSHREDQLMNFTDFLNFLFYLFKFVGYSLFNQFLAIASSLAGCIFKKY